MFTVDMSFSFKYANFFGGLQIIWYLDTRSTMPGAQRHDIWVL